MHQIFLNKIRPERWIIMNQKWKKNVLKKGVTQWLLTEFKKYMEKRDKILRKGRKTRKYWDWSNYKQLKNQCNMIKHVKQKYHNNLITNISINPKAFWKAVMEVFPTEDITSIYTIYYFWKDFESQQFLFISFISCWILENISITIEKLYMGYAN